MSKPGWRQLDANAHEAMVRFYSRTGWEPVCVDLPFDELLASEDDGADGAPGEYEIRQRMLGVKAFFRFLKARGLHPSALLKQLAAVGRAIHETPFDSLTMHEVGQLFSETAAAHSWRCKLLSGEIRLSGMKGTRLPGQKTEAASESYKICRKGNQNRKGGKKRRGAHGVRGAHGGKKEPVPPAA